MWSTIFKITTAGHCKHSVALNYLCEAANKVWSFWLTILFGPAFSDRGVDALASTCDTSGSSHDNGTDRSTFPDSHSWSSNGDHPCCRALQALQT